MYPTELADTTSFCGTGSTLTLLRGSAGYTGDKNCLRVTMRGGFSFDAPAEAVVQDRRVSELRTGFKLYSPYYREAPPGPTETPYEYEWSDNKKRVIHEKGTYKVSPDHAELLGWLLGDGTLHAERQSLRFSNSDVWVLTHVQNLVERLFPQVKVSWYAKNAGYDITLTAGIRNPLRSFIRSMDFRDGWPVSVSLFDEECRASFLRGLWGANGWVHVRKGGNDVDLGLSRGSDDGFTSLLRDYHASIGMRGQRRETPTELNPNSHRLVFSGYANYRVFYRVVGQIGATKIEAPPVKKEQPPPSLTVDTQGNPWYLTPIQKIRRIGKLPCYEVPHV